MDNLARENDERTPPLAPNDENSVTEYIRAAFEKHVISLSLSLSSPFSLCSRPRLALFPSPSVYTTVSTRRTREIERARARAHAEGMSNLIEIPLCEIVEKSSHAIAGACVKMELQEETRFAR